MGALTLHGIFLRIEYFYFRDQIRQIKNLSHVAVNPVATDLSGTYDSLPGYL
jgi:hypothetical protein